MKVIQKSKIEYYQFESFLQFGCRHGIFTRKGGVSPSPWKSLNQGGTLGDERTRVIENRKRIFDCMERPVETIFDVWQTHGTKTIIAESPRKLESPHEPADAIFTQNPDVTLFMRFADCVPILIFDPVEKVIGIIHAGWQGTVDKIVLKAIDTIKNDLHVDPKNVIAGIGPSIGPDHYVIGNVVEKKVITAFGELSQGLLLYDEDKIRFDLWEANKLLLEQSGVTNIEVSNICTACHTEEWFSHRAENSNTGRFGALLALDI
jgi:polyphenol oxidase